MIEPYYFYTNFLFLCHCLFFLTIANEKKETSLSTSSSTHIHMFVIPNREDNKQMMCCSKKNSSARSKGLSIK